MYVPIGYSAIAIYFVAHENFIFYGIMGILRYAYKYEKLSAKERSFESGTEHRTNQTLLTFDIYIFLIYNYNLKVIH